MDPWRKLSFQANGPTFHPGRTGVVFLESHEPGTVATFGGRRGEVVPFGGALYRVPDNLPQGPRDSHLETSLAHLAQLLPAFRSAGATSFILHMHRRFQGQCNEEFTQSELRTLLSLECRLFYVARADDGVGT